MTRQRLKPRQSPPIVIYQGDDMATLSELRRAADHAKVNGSRTDDGADEEITYQAFVDEAAGRAVEVVVQAIGPKRWQDLVLAHPPRMVPEEIEAERAVSEDEPQRILTGKMIEHDDDFEDGVNTLTFPRALLMYVDPERPEIQTLIQPEFDDEADRAEFVDTELAQGDFDRLWRLAMSYNDSRSRDPKEGRSDQRSDESTT